MSVIELDQKRETRLTTFHRGGFTVRYAYSRSKDARDEGSRGEDYLVARIELNRVVFAVCDGVGSSFFGGLAAQILGESLLNWSSRSDVAKMLSNHADPATVTEGLNRILNAQTELATSFVKARDLSRIESQRLRESLKSIRDTIGSQSNFVFGIIEARSKELPEGRIWLFWLGDAILRGWCGDKDVSNLLEPLGQPRTGWSSKSGVLGEIQSYSCDLTQMDCIMAYSDGLAHGGTDLKPGMVVNEFDTLVEKLGELPTSDDISYFEISIAPGIFDGTDDLVDQLRTTATSVASVSLMPSNPDGTDVSAPQEVSSPAVAADIEQETAKKTKSGSEVESRKQDTARTWKSYALVFLFLIVVFLGVYLVGALFTKLFLAIQSWQMP